MWVMRLVKAQTAQRATAQGDELSENQVGQSGVSPSSSLFPSLSRSFCLDRTLVLGSQSWSKEMTYDQDFGKLDHTSPGISSGHSLARAWLSEAEAEGADSPPRSSKSNCVASFLSTGAGDRGRMLGWYLETTPYKSTSQLHLFSTFEAQPVPSSSPQVMERNAAMAPVAVELTP